MLQESPELARILIYIGSRNQSECSLKVTSKIIATLYYEPAFQLGLDMLKKLKQFDEIALALVHEG